MSDETSLPPADLAVAAAVSEVLVRYATAIDTRNWDLFRTCFTADVDADYGTMPTGEVLRWHDVETMAAWMEASHRDMGHTLHRITNQHVHGSGDRVSARCYVAVLLMTPAGETIADGAGYYDDELIHTHDGWQIARRRFTAVRMLLGSP